jgi:hypothetical protein
MPVGDYTGGNMSEWQGDGPLRYISHAVKGWYNKYGKEPYYWVTVQRQGVVTTENLPYLLDRVESEFEAAKAEFIALLRANVDQEVPCPTP